ncbi:hypothetical protein, partial [Streptococcus pneumoniae]|uniref:hypothetical protein n=1 Tax=Streptococcus pneumoniae TaxID=1313 RepID=UPI001E5E4A2C
MTETAYIGDPTGSDNRITIMNFLAQPVSFGTNGTERLFIDPLGNVGIGTSTPGSLLSLYGG